MGFKFFAAFGKEKMQQASQSLTEAIVRFDPETATEAAIDLMEEQVDELSLELAKSNQELQKERKEADAARANYNRKLEAAKKLQEQIDSSTGKKRASLETSLNSLLEDLENTQPDVQLEIQEAEDAQAVVDEIEATLKLAADKLKTARSDHKRAQGDMKRAEMAEKRAKAEEARAKQQAGISNTTDGMSVALDAMKSAANDRQASAEASRTKADLLKPFDATQDDNVAAALAEVDGVEEPADTKSKLAGLKGF